MTSNDEKQSEPKYCLYSRRLALVFCNKNYQNTEMQKRK